MCLFNALMAVLLAMETTKTAINGWVKYQGMKIFFENGYILQNSFLDNTAMLSCRNYDNSHGGSVDT